MEDSGWSRVYFTVLVLFVILAPLAGYVAVTGTMTTAYTLREIGSPLPSTTALFIWLGPLGHALVGLAGLAIMAIMGRWRDSQRAATVCVAVFVLCMGFYLFSALSAHVPFWSITWRLGR